MRYFRRSPLRWPLALGAAVAGAGGVSYEVRKQTLAPHELNDRDAPAPILRAPPALPDGSINFESAEERNLRIVVVAKGLQQPWSMAFLPDGAILVTERPGRLRIVRNGRLMRELVVGVPPVQTGGPRGLQGLMDIALHPRFNENSIKLMRASLGSSSTTLFLSLTAGFAGLYQVNFVLPQHAQGIWIRRS